MTAMDEPLLLTVREAAALLRISRNSMYELVSRRELPSIRLGRSIRIPRHALEAWLLNASFVEAGQRDPAGVR